MGPTRRFELPLPPRNRLEVNFQLSVPSGANQKVQEINLTPINYLETDVIVYFFGPAVDCNANSSSLMLKRPYTCMKTSADVVKWLIGT
jgi:hypothetical protein